MLLDKGGAVGVENAGKNTVGKIANRDFSDSVPESFRAFESYKTRADDKDSCFFVYLFFKSKRIVKG